MLIYPVREYKSQVISPKRAKEVWDDLSYLLPNFEVLYFPALEVIPFEVLAQSAEIQRQRLQVLATLSKKKKTIVISPVEALTKALIPPQLFYQGIKDIEVGQVVDLQELKEYLVQYGYERVEQVESPGQFNLRGGILDLYSVLYDKPIRIEFFDDEVDSIRFFNVDSQRSLEKTSKVTLVPAREFFLLEENREKGLLAIGNEFEIQKQRLAKKKDRNALEKLTSKINEVVEKVINKFYSGT